MAFAIALLLLVASACIVVVSAPAVVLRSCRAVEADADQAPTAFAILAELSTAAGCERPRLFVIPSSQANGLAIVGRRGKVVALTEEVFERLSVAQLRGMLAILVAMASHPGARLATSLAALAIGLLPLAPAAHRLCRWAMPAHRRFAIDRRAAELIGTSGVISALQALAPSALIVRGPQRDLAWKLCCVSFVTTNPTVDSRARRLVELPPAGPSEASSNRG